ncbi:MAG: molybdopterin dinucleotide binding domain-containing protein, partial [Streptosporangiaceae bacterium]
AAGQRSLILTAHGDGQQARGADTVTAFINLALGLGLPGTAGSGYGCVTGHGRRGRLPGHRGVADPAVCEHLASVWGVHPEVLPGPGRSAYELLRAFGTGGGPRALLLFGSDPVVSAPRAAEVEERLNTLDLLVVADRVLSETAQRADVVLPTAQRAGESGGRTDLEILAGLGSRLGTPGPWTTAGDRTEQESGLFWPCPQTADQHPGTARPFLAGFATPDGRARFTPVGHRGPDEDTDSEYPIHLTTGEVPAHDQGGAPSRHAVLEQFVELNPDLAERLGVLDGEPVRITSRQGISVARARVTDTIRADSVFMPFHRADAARDPIAWMPESLVCAVRVEPGTHGDREAP